MDVETFGQFGLELVTRFNQRPEPKFSNVYKQDQSLPAELFIQQSLITVINNLRIERDFSYSYLI